MSRYSCDQQNFESNAKETVFQKQNPLMGKIYPFRDDRWECPFERVRSNIHFMSEYLIKPLRPDLLKSSLTLAAFMVPTFFTVAHLPSQMFALKIQESPTKLSHLLDNTSLQCHELFCKQNQLYSYGTKAWWLKFKYSNLFTAFFSWKRQNLS